MVSRAKLGVEIANQHAMPLEFRGKWETGCLNSRFPLPSLLYAGYSVIIQNKKTQNKKSKRSTFSENVLNVDDSVAFGPNKRNEDTNFVLCILRKYCF